MTMIDEAAFHVVAEQTLDDLFAVLDRVLGDDHEIDLDGGFLSIRLATGGQYLVNKNAPMRQVWLSSPTTGGWHFDWDEANGQWRSTRDPAIGLNDVLSRELAQATGVTLAL